MKPNDLNDVQKETLERCAKSGTLTVGLANWRNSIHLMTALALMDRGYVIGGNVGYNIAMIGVGSTIRLTEKGQQMAEQLRATVSE